MSDIAALLREAADEIERLRELAGSHDPTGADHMEEMWEHAQRADAAEAQNSEMRQALAYIARPTMGLPAGYDPEDWALNHASEDAVRQALRTCMYTAAVALSRIEEPNS